MKRIHVNKPVAGASYSYAPGFVECEDAVADDLVRAGHAEYVDENPRKAKSERATAAKVETVDRS